MTEKYKATVQQLVLIFAGKILKDGDKISEHHIKDKHVIHLVIKAAAKASTPQATVANPVSENVTNVTSSTTSTTPSTNQSTPNVPFGLGGYCFLEIGRYVFFGADVDTDISAIQGLIADTDN